MLLVFVGKAVPSSFPFRWRSTVYIKGTRKAVKMIKNLMGITGGSQGESNNSLIIR